MLPQCSSSVERCNPKKKATDISNCWLAASSWQCACSCITSHAEVFGKTSNHPGDSAPLQPRFGALRLLAFPKTKITFEREEISDHRWDSGKYYRAADGNWENCVRYQGAYMKGTEASLSSVQCFLYLCLLQSISLFFFLCYVAGYLLDRPLITVRFMYYDFSV